MIKFIKFLLVGGTATLFQFALLWLFVEFNWLSATIASAASYAISAVFNYLLNYHLTFKSTHSHAQTLPKFIVTAAIGVCLNTGLFSLFNISFNHLLANHPEFLETTYLMAQLFATLLTLIANFLLHKLWIYRRHS